MISDSAEPVARVVADLLAGRVRRMRRNPDDEKVHAWAFARIKDPTVVDATILYESLAAKEAPIALYEDHPCIAPPWDESAICYVNGHGNVCVMHSTAHPVTERWEPADPVDWDRVRWQLDTFVWLGGHGGDGRAFGTAGPMFMWRAAIYDDGEPADLGWVDLSPDYPRENWEMAHLVLLGSLNFLNCNNVTIVEPARPRQQKKRLARTGVTVHTINVFPAGKTHRNRDPDDYGEQIGTAASVRGHFARYGPQYDKGLLFGKYAGRFFIPQHARGERGAEPKTDYRLVPKENRNG